MARTLSAADKDELAALLAKEKPTKVEQARIDFLTAGGPCMSCSDVTPKLAIDDLADEAV